MVSWLKRLGEFGKYLFGALWVAALGVPCAQFLFRLVRNIPRHHITFTDFILGIFIIPTVVLMLLMCCCVAYMCLHEAVVSLSKPAENAKNNL